MTQKTKVKHEWAGHLYRLTERQYGVMHLRWGPGLLQAKPQRTLARIGKLFGVRRERIRQIEVEAIRRLERFIAMPPINRDEPEATPVDAFEWSCRARIMMQRHDIRTLGELAAKSDDELRATKNVGQKTIDEIGRKLAIAGLDACRALT